MGQIKRQTMKFIVPTSNDGTISSDSSGKKEIEVYLNPSSFNISETKLQSSSPTKGGYIISYWGEQLPKITVNGTTGSGGIEAINILRDVYRNEQIVFKKILEERVAESVENLETIDTASSGTSIAGVVGSILGVTNLFAPEDEGVASTVGRLLTQTRSGLEAQKKEILSPSIAAFFTSVDIYFQGEKFRGFFENFTVREGTPDIGHFTYDFSFTVLQRYGRRKNFMPWHRNPTDSSGQAIPAQIPIERTADRLTFPFSPANTTQEEITGTTSTILNTQELTLEPNTIPVIRSISVKS